MAGESGAATMIALPSRTQVVDSQRAAPVNPGPPHPRHLPIEVVELPTPRPALFRSPSTASEAFSLATTYTANSQEATESYQRTPVPFNPSGFAERDLARAETLDFHNDDARTIIGTCEDDTERRWGQRRRRRRRRRRMRGGPTRRLTGRQKRWHLIFYTTVYVILALWLVSACLSWAGPWLSNLG